MTPDEQRAAQARQNVSNYMQERLGAYKQRQQKTDEEYANKQSAQMENDTMNLYKWGLEAIDEETKMKYHVAGRANLLAEMISNKAREKWVTVTGWAKDIVSAYLKSFPDDYQALNDFTHWNQDPEEFAIQMGWMEAPEPKWGFWRNVIGGAGDWATWLWQFIGNWAADIIWWTAKQLWADEDRVNYLVNDFKQYLEDSKISKTVDANTNSGLYKTTKAATELAESVGLWLGAKWAVEAKLWGPLVTKYSPTWAKATVWALEWAADMAIYKPVADQELASPWELVLWAWLWTAFPIAWASLKAWKKAVQKKSVQFAEDLLQNTNRMTKGEQSKFFKRFNQNVGKWLNDRWLKNGDDVIEYFTRSRDKVDNALGAIDWRFTSQPLNDVLDDSLNFAIETKNPQSQRLFELFNKNAEWWLTMSEINEVKRFFEAHNKFNYLTKWTAKQSELATNLDSALREWQYDIAKQNWFGNLAELNNETAAAKEVLNWIKKREAWVKGNNAISLSDVIVAMWGWISPESLASYIIKKEWESPAFRSKVVDMLNYIGSHETMAEKVADMTAIMEANSKKEIERLYKERWVDDLTPKLPNRGGTDAGKTVVVDNTQTISVDPMWNAKRSGQISEINMSWK